MSTPSIFTNPEVGSDRPARMRIVVVFPAPFGPRKPKISPGATVRLSRSTAVKSPYFFVSSRISIMAAAAVDVIIPRR